MCQNLGRGRKRTLAIEEDGVTLDLSHFQTHLVGVDNQLKQFRYDVLAVFDLRLSDERREPADIWYEKKRAQWFC